MKRFSLPDGGAAFVPDWLPEDVARYVAHTEFGHSIRALARSCGCHASTVLRQVRRVENAREDVLIDEALTCLGQGQLAQTTPLQEKTYMTHQPNLFSSDPTADAQEDRFMSEAKRVLRALSEAGAVLAVASEMDKAVVVRETASGTNQRRAVVERDVAQAMALKDWIACKEPGRISRYHITTAGRGAFNRMMAEAENAASGFAEAQTAFAGQHRAHESRGTGGKRVRYNINESPVNALARRKDRDGAPFLTDDLVRAGERLREDFELAQMGPRVTQNWDGFLTAGTSAASGDGSPMERGSGAARTRVAAALRELGPGLGDAVLRCCCYLEGLETAEKRLGWSARSGKIVLRIALQRLKRHYDEQGGASDMIG